MPNLYLIQTTEEYIEHYESAVVCANSEQEAKCIHPDGEYVFINEKLISKECGYACHDKYFRGWAHPKDVQVTFVGVAAKGMQPGTVVCASFNAG